MYALSARRNDMAKTIRSIEVDWLLAVEEDAAKPDLLKGGVEDIGNYREGACFRIRSKTNAVWNLCSDTLPEKAAWIAAFKKLLPKKDIT